MNPWFEFPIFTVVWIPGFERILLGTFSNCLFMFGSITGLFMKLDLSVNLDRWLPPDHSKKAGADVNAIEWNLGFREQMWGHHRKKGITCGARFPMIQKKEKNKAPISLPPTALQGRFWGLYQNAFPCIKYPSSLMEDAKICTHLHAAKKPAISTLVTLVAENLEAQRMTLVYEK